MESSSAQDPTKANSEASDDGWEALQFDPYVSQHLLPNVLSSSKLTMRVLGDLGELRLSTLA